MKNKINKAELEMVERRLRYMSPENIAADFHSERERAAIAAVFKWLSLNGICAWELKRPGTYSTTAMSKTVRRDFGTSNAIVLENERYEHAKAVLGLKEKK